MKKILMSALFRWFIDETVRIKQRLHDLREQQSDLILLRDDAKKRHAKYSHLQKRIDKTTAEIRRIETDLALKG